MPTSNSFKVEVQTLEKSWSHHNLTPVDTVPLRFVEVKALPAWRPIKSGPKSPNLQPYRHQLEQLSAPTENALTEIMGDLVLDLSN
jgi:hypothetical protein